MCAASQPPTEELLDRVRAGDPRAADDLLSRHRDRLRKMIRARLDPRLHLSWARSVVSLAYPYRPPPPPTDDWRAALAGRIAAYALGEDYHHRLRALCRRLVGRLARRFPGTRFLHYVDTGPILEREWATRAGLGWIGRHTLVLHRALGSYFLLAEFYSGLPARYEAVDEPDLHSPWSLEEGRRHEAARLRDMVAREWLFYSDDPRASAEFRAYREAELAAPGQVNVRFERLSRFSTLQPNWLYYSPGFEASVLRHLAHRWPLEYRVDLEQAESP